MDVNRYVVLLDSPGARLLLCLYRTEALTLILVLASTCLYTPAGVMRQEGNVWHSLLVSQTKPNLVMAILSSLINVVMHYDPVGMGVPYNYLMFADTKEALAEAALQTFLILIDYSYPLGELSEVHVAGLQAADTSMQHGESTIGEHSSRASEHRGRYIV